MKIPGQPDRALICESGRSVQWKTKSSGFCDTEIMKRKPAKADFEAN